MEQNPVDSLNEEQRPLYYALDDADRLYINNKITDKNTFTDYMNNNPNLVIEIRQPVRDMIRQTQLNINLSDEAINRAFNTAKQELLDVYESDINLMLQGGQVPLRRAAGGGIIGELTSKVVEILSRPVGGKLRKTSNKKRSTARRRRSSKARKARKARKSRSTRRR
jgi:hypothetical protein